jgi:hypothetical protein
VIVAVRLRAQATPAIAPTTRPMTRPRRTFMFAS